MGPSIRLAFIGNSLPRQCGIATFTTDLQQAVAKSRGNIETAIVAMTDHNHTYHYPSAVRFQVNDEQVVEYQRAADFLNAGNFQAVSLQHEFGVFGGEAGNHIMALLSRLTMPVITTLHTVLAQPRAVQHSVLKKVIDSSAKVIVMAEKAGGLLRTVYGVPDHKIEMIPHGIPDTAFVEPDAAKAVLGFAGKPIILTFGLLSPNKGIEVMIDAMPSILKQSPDSIYVVLGATHPNLVRQEGERYRERLVARAQSLGVEDHVVFLNRFVDQTTLLEFISMCDVYVTPYLNEAQMTSGTLAYSFGLGKAVVSTPYWHAQELLADGRGVLVPFGDAKAIAAQIGGLLTDDSRRFKMRVQAYSNSRSMIWARTAERYLSVFDSAQREHRPNPAVRRVEGIQPALVAQNPQLQLSHFMSMCDDTGLLQHAICSVPDRSHGYCVDDNARALLLACALNAPGEKRLSEILISRFAAFIQHSWNPTHRRFRNFMSFERRWLEEVGSEDSHGRALWALGECVRTDPNESRRRWAAALFLEALPATEGFSSPRAWAFTLLGLDAYCVTLPSNCYARELRHVLADRLTALMASVETQEWPWFESGFGYDNARLPQALILTGTTLSAPGYIAAGLKSLRWLMTQQTSAEGHFRPIGSESFGDQRQAPKAFDQQPLEATASISACLAAWRLHGDGQWQSEALRAFAWFLGANDLSIALVDVETGSCRDGLHPTRANENRGGESVVSYLLSVAEIRQHTQAAGKAAKSAPLLALTA